MRVGNEVQVGVAVVAALVLSMIGYFFLRNIGLRADIYYLRLNGPAIVAPGNDVRIQGVRVGEIQDVVLDPNTQKPLLTLAVRHNNKLLHSYTYSVEANALIGESFVNIHGTYDPNGMLYQPNDKTQVIEGTAAAGMAGLTDQATVVMKDVHTALEKFDVTLDRVNNGVFSPDNQIKLTRALDNVNQMTSHIAQAFGPQGVKVGFGDPHTEEELNRTLAGTAEATHNVGELVAENRTEVHQLFINLSRTSDNVAGLTESLNFLVHNGGLQQNTSETFKSLRVSAQNVEATTAKMRGIVADPATLNDIHASLTALRQAAEGLRDTSKTIEGTVGDPRTQTQIRDILTTLDNTVGTLQTTVANLRDASGGLKNVLGDPQVQNNLKAIPAEINGTLQATRDTVERIDSLLGGRRNRNMPAGGATGATGASGAARNSAPAAPAHLGYEPGGFDFEYRHLMDVTGGPRAGSDLDGYNYGDLTFNTDLFGGPFRLGVANIGDGDNLTAQTGRFFAGSQGALRYGLYRSKLGIGADYHLGRFLLEGNFWDPNNRSENGYLGYQLTPEVQLLLGRESIGGVRADSVGVKLSP